jgi:hypothetical protein
LTAFILLAVAGWKRRAFDTIATTAGILSGKEVKVVIHDGQRAERGRRGGSSRE